MKIVITLLVCAQSLFASVALKKGAAVSGNITPGSSLQIRGDFSAASFAGTVITANSPTISKVVPADKDKLLLDGSKMLQQSKTSTSVLIRGNGLPIGSQITWKAPGAAEVQNLKEEADSAAGALQVELVPL